MHSVSLIDSKSCLALCCGPIKFTECVLLLEAAALNYSADYYHNAATVGIVHTLFSQIQTLFSRVMRLTGVQKKKKIKNIVLES